MTGQPGPPRKPQSSASWLKTHRGAAGDVQTFAASGGAVQGQRDIADILGASPATVKKHLERIHAKMGVETRTAAAAMAIHRVPMLGPSNAGFPPRADG